MEENGSKGSPGLGNTITKPEPKKRITASKYWCFTLNNYTKEEYDSIITFLNLAPNKYIIGKEKGEKGTPHLQGYINFEDKCRPLEKKELCKRIHWEKCKGTEEDNIKYCSKDGDYIVKGLKVNKPIKLIKEDMLYTWQKEIIEVVKKEPDDRVIYWYWSDGGKVGKTQFAKYLSYHYGAVPVDGKKNDILFCTATFDSDIYIFDFERTCEEYISYGAMEKVKNGYYMCAKYESKPIIRNPPHIICFANFPPDYEALSKDRWVVKKLD